jgi:hypothetical protein
MRTLIATFIAIAVVTMHTGAAKRDSKGDWAKSQAKRAAVLTIDLYSLDMKIGFSGVDTRGILFASPGKSLFYRWRGISDIDANQMMTRLGDPNDLYILRKLSVGSKVTVKEITTTATEIHVFLWDEFSQQKGTTPPSSTFTVEWPAKFSVEFSEQPDVEAQIARVLTFPAK